MRNPAYLSLAIIFGILMAIPHFARAATLFLSPAAGTYEVGSAFVFTVRVNTEEASMNAAQGTLTFDPRILQVISLSTDGSLSNLNFQEPEFSNTAGTIRWGSIIMNPGYQGTSGLLFTARLRAIAPGAGTVHFSSARILANDGKGTDLLSNTQDGTYTLTTHHASTTVPTPYFAPLSEWIESFFVPAAPPGDTERAVVATEVQYPRWARIVLKFIRIAGIIARILFSW